MGWNEELTKRRQAEANELLAELRSRNRREKWLRALAVVLGLAAILAAFVLLMALSGCAGDVRMHDLNSF
jgi:ferric-dicitrate binding protein FerR (iron transport regulator)